MARLGLGCRRLETESYTEGLEADASCLELKNSEIGLGDQGDNAAGQCSFSTISHSSKNVADNC